MDRPRQVAFKLQAPDLEHENVRGGIANRYLQGMRDKDPISFFRPLSDHVDLNALSYRNFVNQLPVILIPAAAHGHRGN